MNKIVKMPKTDPKFFTNDFRAHEELVSLLAEVAGHVTITHERKRFPELAKTEHSALGRTLDEMLMTIQSWLIEIDGRIAQR